MFAVQPRASDDTPTIMCAICQKPVDHVYWRSDDFDKQLFVEVKCHGETDSMTADSFSLYEMNRTGNMKAEAFTTKRIAAEPPAE